MNLDLSIPELLSCLCQCTTEHGGYVCFQEKLEDLKSEMEKLQRLRDNINTRMERADRENELIHKVNFWLSNVQAIEAKIAPLVNHGSQELENNCLGSCCPKNCWSRYRIGKKIQNQLMNVRDSITRGQGLLDEPMETTVDKISKCLIGETGSIIGVHGKGGVGKTAVLTEISKSILNSEHRFDFVIWAVVSQDINLGKIQADVAKEIGFFEDRWKDKTQQERATDMLNVLSQKKFLLLLDDIWEQVDVTKIGVPLPDRGNNSKIVFTTRTEKVCDEMGAEEKIQVLRLTEKKALELFRKKVGNHIINVHPEIPQLAECIGKICDGLPLALITVGRAMASKETLQEWHNSIKVIKRYVSEFSGANDPVYALLKFSYDCLPSEKVKCCFLYCTLFPEDFSINKFNLIDYWIGEGFLGEFDDEARNEGYKIINILIQACLLEDEGKDVKMHDLIREVALWIACEYGKLKDKYLVEAGAQLSEAPEIGRWERVRRMSLKANHIQNLTKAPSCNDLLTLFVGSNRLKMIANNFFQFMPSLKVVDLSENRELTELPSGISKVTSLQYLNLSRTGIRQLPIELKNLVKLKCLNLEYTYELQTIPLQVISSFSNLNVLRMLNCASDRVIGDGIRTGGHESLLRDLEHLGHLNVLTITIRNQYMLHLFKSIDKFQACTQSLSFQHFKHSSSLDISCLKGMKCLDNFELVDCTNLTDICVEESLITRKACFNSLRKVSIDKCSKLKDLTWLTHAPNLKFVVVSRCSNMEKIICEGKLGEGSVNAFAKLEVLRLVSLQKLKSIYPIPLPFRYLKEIIVDECPELRKLPLDSNSATGHTVVILGWEDWWKNLEWEDKATKTIFHHSFKACMY